MHDNSFKQFRRSQIAELRPYVPGEDMGRISISAPDTEAGSPKTGDMIARNPANHDDQWLVAAEYFAANFEPLDARPRPRTTNFYSRLKAEREQLSERLEKLNAFMGRSYNVDISPAQVDKLKRQSAIMSEYLAVLDERLADLAIAERSTTQENSNDPA